MTNDQEFNSLGDEQPSNEVFPETRSEESSHEMDDDLGSLAQSARSNNLKSARITMYVIGVLTIVANLAVLLMAEGMIDREIEKELNQIRGQGMLVDQAEVDRIKQQAVTLTQMVSVGFAALGVVFLILGAQVNNFPVPCTVLALVLYLAGQAITAMFDPTMLVRGLIIKIIIIVALINAVKAASAYQRDREIGLT